jgi:hypothetical protein
MSTLEIAIQKIKQFTPEQQQKVIEFIEFLEFQTQREHQTDQLDETSDSIAIEGIKEGLQQAINDETIPLTQIWEDVVIASAVSSQQKRPAFGVLKESGKILGDIVEPVVSPTTWEVLQ